MRLASRLVARLAATALVLTGCESVIGLSDLEFGGAGGASASSGGDATSGSTTSAVASGASTSASTATGDASSSGTGSAGGDGGAGGSGAGGGGGDTGGAGAGGRGPTYADLVLAGGPVWYFRFEEQTDSIVAENLGSSPNEGIYFRDAGTITWEVPGTLDREGQPGRAVTLGNEARVIVEDSAAAQLTSEAAFSFEVWLTQSEFGEFGSMPFGCRTEGAEPNGWLVYFGTSGIYIKHYGVDGSGNPASQGIPSAVVPAEGLHHVVFVMGDDRELRTYVDGALIVADVAIDVTIAPHEAPAILGEARSDGGPITIDELAIYDRALSGQEVQAHYFCGALGLCDEGG